jgi:hypothetical protein
VGKYEAQQNSLSETEVSIKMQAYHKSDTNIEMIEVLTTISQVSARMARNLKSSPRKTIRERRKNL